MPRTFGPVLLAVAVLIVPGWLSAANTYYIDCASRNDSNNGTSQTTPWKHQPYMQGRTGTYGHQAGDRFIFKGGVTCPAAYFTMNITSGGSSGNNDYYGVDQS